MSRLSHLPKQFPVGTKYVVEAHGEFVTRYVEYPDGRQIRLSKRKRRHYYSVEPVVGLVPDQAESVTDQPVFGRRIFA